MSRVKRDYFVAVPATLNAQHHPDFDPTYLLTYFSIASRAGNDENEPNYARSYPKIPSIAEKVQLTTEQVRRAISWLRENGYLWVRRRPDTSNEYTLILNRDLFLRVRQNSGPEKAKEAYEAWLRQQLSGRG